MNTQVIKSIVIGALLGALIFAIPFMAIKLFFFLLVVGLVFKLIRGRGRRYYGPAGWAYADKIRQMSDDEYQQFKNRYSRYCWGGQDSETSK